MGGGDEAWYPERFDGVDGEKASGGDPTGKSISLS